MELWVDEDDRIFEWLFEIFFYYCCVVYYNFNVILNYEV